MGASGGTLATRAAMSGAGEHVRQAMADPFSLGGFVPDIDRNGIKRMNIEYGTGKLTPKIRAEDMDSNMSRITQDKRFPEIFRGPHVYSYFDTRIVRRSNMLFADLGNCPYGRNLNFLEFIVVPQEELDARAGGGKGKSVEEEKKRLEEEGRYYGAGEGPPLEELDDAYTVYQMYAESTNGHELKYTMMGRDGYYETARVAIETALTLLFDRDKLPFKGGCLTPTVAGGQYLVDRVVNSGIVFKKRWLEDAELGPPAF